MHNGLFDFNQDGKPDAAESALEYMNFRAVTGADVGSDDDDRLCEDSDSEADSQL